MTIKLPVDPLSGPNKHHRAQHTAHQCIPLVCLVERNFLLRPLLLNTLRNKQKIRTCLPESTRLSNGTLSPNMFVLDRGTLGTSFHFRLSQIATRFPNARIAVLDEPLEPAEQSLLIKIGVHGFMPYSSLDKHFVSLAAALMSGKLWFKPNILAYHIQAHVAKSLSAKGACDGLTGRQREILLLIKEGLSNKEISARLVISESTVKFHLAKMFDKFEIHNKRSLVSHFEKMQNVSGL